MTGAVFVDTNVLLYARDAGEPVKRPLAAAWLEHLWREQLGRTSVQVLSEYFVNATRKLDPGLAAEDAWDDVQMLATWNPASVDLALLRTGREIEQRYRLSWWDCLIVAAAQVQGCELLLTEDLQDGARFGSVTVRSPFTLALSEAASLYRASPILASKHPRRGRPRKAVVAE